MTFDLIRFPGYILSQYLKTSPDTNIDLSSFNLNLGDFGSARLVATLTQGPSVEQSTISVILSNVDGEDSSLSISCSLLVVNEHGEEISKVFPNIWQKDTTVIISVRAGEKPTICQSQQQHHRPVPRVPDQEQYLLSGGHTNKHFSG